MKKAHVAPALTHEIIAKTLKALYRFPAGNCRQLRHAELDRDCVETNVARRVILENLSRGLFFKYKRDHFLDVFESLIQRFPLRVATGKRGTLNHIIPVLVFFDDEGKGSRIS